MIACDAHASAVSAGDSPARSANADGPPGPDISPRGLAAVIAGGAMVLAAAVVSVAVALPATRASEARSLTAMFD